MTPWGGGGDGRAKSRPESMMDDIYLLVQGDGRGDSLAASQAAAPLLYALPAAYAYRPRVFPTERAIAPPPWSEAACRRMGDVVVIQSGCGMGGSKSGEHMPHLQLYRGRVLLCDAPRARCRPPLLIGQRYYPPYICVP